MEQKSDRELEQAISFVPGNVGVTVKLEGTEVSVVAARPLSVLQGADWCAKSLVPVGMIVTRGHVLLVEHGACTPVFFFEMPCLLAAGSKCLRSTDCSLGRP